MARHVRVEDASSDVSPVVDKQWVAFKSAGYARRIAEQYRDVLFDEIHCGGLLPWGSGEPRLLAVSAIDVFAGLAGSSLRVRRTTWTGVGYRVHALLSEVREVKRATRNQDQARARLAVAGLVEAILGLAEAIEALSAPTERETRACEGVANTGG